MHVVSTLSQSAAAAKYILPVSNTSCTVTHRLFVAMLLLFDVSVRLPTAAAVGTRNNRVRGGWRTQTLPPCWGGIGPCDFPWSLSRFGLGYFDTAQHSFSLKEARSKLFPRAICVRFDTNAGQPEITKPRLQYSSKPQPCLDLFLQQASVVVFLLAKVKVTNGDRTLACWEKGITWWSRLYGWGYL